MGLLSTGDVDICVRKSAVKSWVTSDAPAQTLFALGEEADLKFYCAEEKKIIGK